MSGYEQSRQDCRTSLKSSFALSDSCTTSLCKSSGCGGLHKQAVQGGISFGVQVVVAQKTQLKICLTSQNMVLKVCLCRDLCISTGKKTSTDTSQPDDNCNPGSLIAHPDTNELLSHSSIRQHNPVDWRRMFFRQSYALSFNGINDYVQLPCGVLHGCDALTIDMMVLAHPIRPQPPQDVTATLRRSGAPPAGGMLFGCQDREFGRSRRAARLHTLPLLYIGTDGLLRSALGKMCGGGITDGTWHRVTLTMVFLGDGSLIAGLYLDAQLVNMTTLPEFSGLPSYPILGSGITEGHAGGASMPVYNCHSFHGLIDELRLWQRPLQPYEVHCMLSAVLHFSIAALF